MAKEINYPRSGDEKKEKKAFHKRPLLYIFSFIVLIIIVVTFIGGPIIARTASEQRELIFGYYRNTPIEYEPGNYFARQREILAERAKEYMESENINSLLYQIWRGAFNNTLFHEAVMYNARKSGLTVSDKTVDKLLARHPGFWESGSFSEDRYQAMPSGEKYQLREYYKETYIHQKFVNDFVTNVFHSENESQFASVFAGPQRNFQYVNFSYSDFPQAEVVKYGKANKDLFKRVNLSVITITSSKDEAEEVRSQLMNQTASFEDLAQTYSQDVFADVGGDMGWTYFYDLRRDFPAEDTLEVFTTAETGDITDVLRTNYGWVIYRIDEPVQEPNFTDQDTVQTVRNYMTTYERGIIEDYLVAQGQKLRERAVMENFGLAADQYGKSVERTGFFPINYGNLSFLGSPQSEEGVFQGGLSRADFFTELFSLEQNQMSDPVVLQENVVVFRFIEERAAEESRIELLTENFSYISRQFISEELQRTLLDSENIKDNFDQMFSRYILQRDS
jgi:hypothetical protein